MPPNGPAAEGVRRAGCGRAPGPAGHAGGRRFTLPYACSAAAARAGSRPRAAAGQRAGGSARGAAGGAAGGGRGRRRRRRRRCWRRCRPVRRGRAARGCRRRGGSVESGLANSLAAARLGDGADGRPPSPHAQLGAGPRGPAAARAAGDGCAGGGEAAQPASNPPAAALEWLPGPGGCSPAPQAGAAAGGPKGEEGGSAAQGSGREEGCAAASEHGAHAPAAGCLARSRATQAGRADGRQDLVTSGCSRAMGQFHSLVFLLAAR